MRMPDADLEHNTILDRKPTQRFKKWHWVREIGFSLVAPHIDRYTGLQNDRPTIDLVLLVTCLCNILS